MSSKGGIFGGIAAAEAEELAAAARHWITGRRRATAEELAAAGEPPEVVEAIIAAGGDQSVEEMEILPKNWPAVLLFLALSTQWRYAGMDGRATGLIYSEIMPALTGRPDIAPVDDYSKLFPRLQLLERAALEVFAQQRQ